MNERIRELAGKSLDKAVPYTWHNLDHIEVEKVMKEFAELIVQECGVALSPMLRDMVSRGQAYDLIKQHFGVEE